MAQQDENIMAQITDCMPTVLLRLIMMYVVPSVSIVEIVTQHIDHGDASSATDIQVRTTDPATYRPIPMQVTCNFGFDLYLVSSRFLTLDPPLDPWSPIYVVLNSGLNSRGGVECCVFKLLAAPPDPAMLKKFQNELHPKGLRKLIVYPWECPRSETWLNQHITSFTTLIFRFGLFKNEHTFEFGAPRQVQTKKLMEEEPPTLDAWPIGSSRFYLDMSKPSQAWGHTFVAHFSNPTFNTLAVRGARDSICTALWNSLTAVLIPLSLVKMLAIYVPIPILDLRSIVAAYVGWDWTCADSIVNAKWAWLKSSLRKPHGYLTLFF